MGFTMCEYTFTVMSVICLILTAAVIGLYSQGILRKRKVQRLQKRLEHTGETPTEPIFLPIDR